MHEDDVLLIDKPAGLTSFGVVARIRRVLTEQKRAFHQQRGYCQTKNQPISKCRCKVKVGHTGTLDPFATGLMIIVTGKECRNASHYTKLDKTYETTIELGKISTTGDPEGEINAASFVIPSLHEVEAVLPRFTGKIMQTPPAFSAIKINGRRAYHLAREGKRVDMPVRQVTVYKLELINYDYPYLHIRVQVSSGTYIRSLAEDIGRELGVGAYCLNLRRLSVGEWKVTSAKTLQDFGLSKG